MRRILLIALLFTSIKTFGQDFDNLMVKKQLDCSDISYNSALLFEKYFTDNKIDSAKYLLDYWKSKCGLREPVERARLLLAINEGNFQDSLLTERIVFYIFNYQNRMNMIKYHSSYSYDNYKPYYGYIPIGQEFDKFTQKAFNNLKVKYKPEDIEYLLCEFYSDNCDTIFSKIQTNAYRGSMLAKVYNKITEEYLSIPEFHMSWITGIWIPTGNLKKLGSHPELGFQMGVKNKKMNYDLIMAINFGNSANSYYARRTVSSNLELTNHFLGGHIGIDIGRDIFAKKGHELQLIGGIALDGFDVLEEVKDQNLKAATTWTYNFNFGLGYRYYVTNGFYLGLRAKYNVVDYTLNKLIDFTGNPITIQFIVGGVSNIFRNNNLKALRYKLRK